MPVFRNGCRCRAWITGKQGSPAIAGNSRHTFANASRINLNEQRSIYFVNVVCKFRTLSAYQISDTCTSRRKMLEIIRRIYTSTGAGLPAETVRNTRVTVYVNQCSILWSVQAETSMSDRRRAERYHLQHLHYCDIRNLVNSYCIALNCTDIGLV